MNRKEFSEKAILSFYGELEPEEEKELTRFLEDHPDYIQEYRELVRILGLSREASLEVPGELCVEARERLDQILPRQDLPSESRPRLSTTGGESFLGTLARGFFASGWARGVAGVVLGLAAGVLLVGDRDLSEFEFRPGLSFPDGEIVISDVRFSSLDQEERQVSLSFSATRNFHFTERVDSPELHRLLAHSLLSEENPGVRIEAVEMLGDLNAVQGQAEIKQALLTAVITDQNPVVRSEALAALRKYPADKQIMEVLVNVLRFDRNSRMRMEAVAMLTSMIEQGEPVSTDNLEAIRRQVDQEENLFLKDRLNTIIKRVNLEKL